MTSEDDVRIYELCEGEVIDDKDPQGRRRVKAKLLRCRYPIDDTGWLSPRTIGGGGAQRGAHMVPKVGSRVLVQFIAGDPAHGVYESGEWSTPDGESTDLPNDMSDAGIADNRLVQGLEVGDEKYAVRFTVDERDGHRAFRAYAVAKEEDGTETTLGCIEFDLEQRMLGIYGLAAVVIRSQGAFRAEGILMSLGDRPVRMATGAPI